MAKREWEPVEELPDGKCIAYNNRTKRWYLYNKRSVLITSNRKKQVLLDWKEGE